MKLALFIDFDGTLCHDKFWRSLEPKLLERVAGYVFGENQGIVDEWMRGAYTSEEIHQRLSEDLGIPYHFLWNVFMNDCRTMVVEKTTLEKIQSLRSNYLAILMTDNMDCFDRFTVPALDLGAYFDYIINSYNEKTSKNDNEGALFCTVASRVGVKIEESILLDNSEKTCELFEKRGGESFLVSSKKPLFHLLTSMHKNFVLL